MTTGKGRDSIAGAKTEGKDHSGEGRGNNQSEMKTNEKSEKLKTQPDVATSSGKTQEMDSNSDGVLLDCASLDKGDEDRGDCVTAEEEGIMDQDNMKEGCQVGVL